ncbi:hypothetical protein [Rheinheimera soli]|uniref:hypothetical protein n=1 Tax=Rheinheimera soli TaxID=443616 RepID=UPI001E39CA11|nr:hypothetical protein [Rheinheimera soli]
MAFLICEDGIVSAWLRAVEYLNKQPKKESNNIILDVSNPCKLSASAKLTIDTVSRKINAVDSSKSISTVANTIFPQNLYDRYGRPAFYNKFHQCFDRAKEKGTWGTYFERMTKIGRGKNGSPINQLELTIRKLTEQRKYKAAHEVSILDIENDYLVEGSEIAIYEPLRFGNTFMNMPCLSHISFKVSSQKLDMTAVYRSHYYASKALGNLVGLAQLLNYVARESHIESGRLTCVSTLAKLDPRALGGVKHIQELLQPPLPV